MPKPILRSLARPKDCSAHLAAPRCHAGGLADGSARGHASVAARALLLVPLLGGSACATTGEGTNNGSSKTTAAGHTQASAVAAPPGDATDETGGAAAVGADSPATPFAAQGGGMPPPLPDRVEAGTIPRAALLQVLSAGIPRFLQQVPVEKYPSDGRFQGWRLLELFQGRPEIAAASVVQPGDVIVRVNQHSLERPEQFKTVWDSLAAGSEIVIDIIRGDQPTRVRYLVSDDNLGTVAID